MAENLLQISDVVHALDMTSPSLHAWFQKEDIGLDAKLGGGWTRFSFRDLCKLAFIRRLTAAGQTLAHASGLARGFDAFAWPPELEEMPEQIKSTFKGHLVVVGRSHEGRAIMVLMMGRDPDRKFLEETFGQTDLVMILDLGQVWAAAIDKAIESREQRRTEKELRRKARARAQKRVEELRQKRAIRQPKPAVRKASAEAPARG